MNDGRQIKVHYLIRFDYGSTRGWQVRLPKWHPLSAKAGREYSEFFSDRGHGGERGAYRAAKERRDKLCKGLTAPVFRRPPANCSHKNSSSGLVGIKLQFRAGRAGEGAFSWRVVWQERRRESAERVTRRRSFSVSLYGFIEALDKAIELREQKVALKYTKQQRAAALDLYKHVARYCSTGKAPRLSPRPVQSPARRII